MTGPQPHDGLRRELRAAADRLIAGTPLRSSGKLTISGLAAEAGIKRWVLTHQHPDLMRQYQAEFKTLGKVPAPLQAAREQISKLRADLAAARADKRYLTDLVNTYAAIIHELGDDLAETQRQRDQARDELRTRQAVVTRITSRNR
ncbi:hypothetical protein DZF91_07520 [Actinomadura logoneensis]|uniref:Uncharacterized protein n=1 Tax=Actinomadura logoneensis TaxID=2293572 RepID=A0A372JR23_9ACTN|nr:hypothetical protein [Actinomadura logoneensis]RFU42256.1 hypothetical protein DZF91_07520 [Actinomadura logoneensis]